MDLVSGIVNLKHAEMASRVQIAVARKMLQNDQMQGAAAIRLIEAASVGTASAGDSLVAAATALGARLDTYA